MPSAAGQDVRQRFEPPPPPTTHAEIDIPARKDAPTPPEAAKIKFVLSGVVVDGSTIYTATQWAPLYQSLVGKEVSLSQIFALRNAMTAKYRKDGYILAQVIVPQQKVADGVVHLQAVEGYVANVTIKGEVHDSRGLIRAMAERIKATRPVTEKVLARQVLLIGDLPGISVRTVLHPASDVPGAADLDIVVTRQAVTGYVAVNNRGSKAIGPLQAMAGINFNSLFGLDEHTGLQLATVNPTRKLHYASLQHDEVFSASGAQLHLSSTYSHSEPGGDIVSLDPLGNSLIFAAGVDYPVLRSHARTLRLGARFTTMDSRVELLGTQFSKDKVRYLSLTADYDSTDTAFDGMHPARTSISVELSQGLDVMGASRNGSPNLSRANGHSDFTRLYAEFERVQSLAGRFSLAFSAAAQLAASPLLSAQQFSLGGSRFGRGYEPSQLLGDDGAAGSIEARYDFATGSPAFSNAQIYAYYEIGRVWDIDPAPGQSKGQSLASAGVGLRFNLFQHISATFELAKPLTRDIASRGNRDIRPLFSILARF